MSRRKKKGKVGRNDACPCGSGKKYKRCCLSKDQEAKLHKPASKPLFLSWADDEMEVLDEMSNRIVTLVDAGQHDEAERLFVELSQRRPDNIDSFDRLALIRRAQGRFKEAEELFLQAAEFARTHPGFEPASVEWYREQAAQAKAMAQSS